MTDGGQTVGEEAPPGRVREVDVLRGVLEKKKRK